MSSNWLRYSSQSKAFFNIAFGLLSKVNHINIWNSIAGFLHSLLILLQKSKQARVPTFVWLLCDDATNAKGPGCDEGTNLRWRDFAVVPLMPTRVHVENVWPKSRPVSRWVGFVGFYQTIKYQNFVCSLKILMFLFSINHTSIFHVLILPIEFSRTVQRSR